MSIQEKLETIIPPNNYEHRYEFSNHDLVDELSSDERTQIEQLLIKKLQHDLQDILIIETLSYMRSENGLHAMRNALENCKNMLQTIIIAVSIYKITHENGLIDIAIDSLNRLTDKWDLVFVFSYLKEFNDSTVNNIIKKYTNDPDFLISHNAKRALGLIKD